MSEPYVIEYHNQEIVSLSDAKDWLRMDGIINSAEDRVISELIVSAVQLAEKTINIHLAPSTFEWITDCPVVIDFAEVRSVEKVEKLVDGEFELVPESEYLFHRTGNLRSRLSWFNPIIGTFKVTFQAGYQTPPAGLLIALRALIGELFDNRADTVAEKRTLSDKILDKYRSGYAG